jgi:hypothetical protein
MGGMTTMALGATHLTRPRAGGRLRCHSTWPGVCRCVGRVRGVRRSAAAGAARPQRRACSSTVPICSRASFGELDLAEFSWSGTFASSVPAAWSCWRRRCSSAPISR